MSEQAMREACEKHRLTANGWVNWADFEAGWQAALQWAAKQEPSNADLLAEVERLRKAYKPWTAIHLKTGNEYTVTGEAWNATNAQDGELMVIYELGGHRYVREADEFAEKFKAKGK